MWAWRPRGLASDAYSSPRKEDTKQYPEQPGEVLLQGSIELRKQLVGFLEGALFIDVGNIWTLHDDGRQNGKFNFQRFYKEIAVGAGLGLRLNFKIPDIAL